jgi:4'-phosphopantetheinyl transferase
MTPSQASIHMIVPDAVHGGWDDLTGSEHSRASKFRFETDAIHWIACRAALRRILGGICGLPPREVPLDLTATGKPLLAPPFDHIHFNISHCPDLALVAVCNQPTGIDIERLDRAPDLLECEETFCHPCEITALPTPSAERADKLLEIWTSKESVLKALGTGLTQPPEEVRVEQAGSSSIAYCDTLPEISHQRIIRLIHPALRSHIAFVSVPASVSEIMFYTSAAMDMITAPRNDV